MQIIIFILIILITVLVISGSTTSNVGFFDKSLYEALNEKAKGYFIEDPQLEWIPTGSQSPAHAHTYKKPILEASKGTKGAHSLGLPDSKMQTLRSYREYALEYVYGDIWYDVNDMLVEGKYLPQRKQQELSTWENHVKQAIFKGVFEGGFTPAGAGIGRRLNNGIIEQATLVIDLDGANSALVAKGDIFKALDKIWSSIPFRLRDGNKVVIGCDDLFSRKARTALFRNNDISELDIWFKEHSDAVYLLKGQQTNDKPMISDSLFLNTVVGTTKTELDVLGTHSRLFAAVVNPEVLEQAYSFRGMMGEDAVHSIGGLNQRWAAKCIGCVHEVEAVTYSEQITW